MSTTLSSRSSAPSPRRGARLLGLALVTIASAASLGLSVAACESATNLDITYGEASAALEGSAGDGANADAEGGVEVPPPGPEILPGCPCDESAGLGCCMPKVGRPFCTSDTAVCAAAGGTHLKCVRPDPSTESVCCWRPDPKFGTLTALAGTCDGGVAACTNDGECAGTGKACNKVTCYADSNPLVIGACGDTKPECPPP